MKSRKQISWTLALCILGGALSSIAHAQDEQAARMRTALAAPDRPAADKERDAARKPIETVQFLGIKTGDTVLEVIAVGGWFTEVLSAAVGPTGKVLRRRIPTFFTSRAGFAEGEKARNDRLKNVTPIHGEIPDAKINGTADAAITALNLHDIYNSQGEAAAVTLVKGRLRRAEAGRRLRRHRPRRHRGPGQLGVPPAAAAAGQGRADEGRLHDRRRVRHPRESRRTITPKACAKRRSSGTRISS